MTAGGPLRILVAADVQPDPNSGAAGTEWQTIQALRRLGHEVDEIWAGDLGRGIQHGNLHYLLELPRAYRSVIAKRCSSNSYDVIHVNQGHCYLAAIDHKRRGRRGVFVCRSHGLDDNMERVLSPWRRRLEVRNRTGFKVLPGAVLDAGLRRHDRLAYRNSSGLIVSSSLDEEYLVVEQGIPRERVARIPQAAAALFVNRPAPPVAGERLSRILHVGGFAYWKGVHAVAAAINMLFGANERGEMTWVCNEVDHDQVRRLLNPEVLKRVTIHGWVTQERLLEIHDRHGIFLAPSLFDGFGKVFLEAMARGSCVVGTPTGGMMDIIRDGENGFLVGFDDPAGIVKVVEGLWRDPGTAARIGVAAAAEARLYSWDRVARETVSFYERLLALGARGET